MKYLSLIFIIISFQSLAQKEKYVGIELGTSKDQFEVLYLTSFGNGYFVDKNKSRSNTKALLLGIKVNNQFSFETGFRTKIYGQDFKIKNTYSSFYDPNTPFYTLSYMKVATSIQIPLRLRFDLNLYKEKIYITSTIGYNLAYNYNKFYDSHEDIFEVYNQEKDTIFFNINMLDNNLNKFFGLVEGSIGLKANLKFNISTFFTYHFLVGFTKINETDIYYKNNSQNPHHTLYSYGNGNYNSFNFGLIYNFIPK